MSLPAKIVAALAALALLGFAALQTGFARWAFFEIFAYVKGVDILGPTVVRLPPEDSPYQRWLERAKQEIPVHEALVIDDIAQAPLRPWPRLGDSVTGLYLRFADYQVTDGRLLELAPGAATVPLQGLYEQGLYVVAGSGRTVLEQQGADPAEVAWRAGDLFSVPLNVRHRHFSDAGAPARLLLVTSFPLMLNVLAEEGFIDANGYAFTSRYDGAPDYFRRESSAELMLVTNFAEGIASIPLRPLEYRGPGNTTIGFDMAGNSMLKMHLSEMPPRVYKKAHRHTSDAFILLLSGEGFSVTWPEGRYDRRERVDWKVGTLFTPPTYWYHQHLNTGDVPARYLAIATPKLIRNLGLRLADQLEVDLAEIRREWEAALEQHP